MTSLNLCLLLLRRITLVVLRFEQFRCGDVKSYRTIPDENCPASTSLSIKFKASGVLLLPSTVRQAGLRYPQESGPLVTVPYRRTLV